MSTPENVVLIVMDTARSDVIDREVTPNIHDLSEQGATYGNAFSCAPWTLPSHTSLFTGTYPSTHQTNSENVNLNPNLATLAEVFQEEGFETRGYSNNVWISRSFGFGKGFDEFVHGWQYTQADNDIGEVSIQHEGTDKIVALCRKVFEGNFTTNLVNTFYAFLHKYRDSNDDGAERTKKKINTWLEERNSSPFFLFVNFLEPHLEYHPPRDVAGKFLPRGVTYDEAMEVPQNAWEFLTGQLELTESDFEILRSLYKAEVHYLDRQIQDVVEAIKTHSNWDDTVLILMGDHGENIGDHGMMDHQYCLYDSLLHVPLIVTGGSFDGEGNSEQLVQLNDIAPTLMDEFGVTHERMSEQCQGQSFHPDLGGRRERVFAEYRVPQPSREAIEERVGDPHDVMERFDQPLSAVRTAQYKLIKRGDGNHECYDLEEDPDEQENIFETSRHNGLLEELTEWENSLRVVDQSGGASMDSDTKERLEDLGYLQG
jgi:arylsulfatase A-like enzyme